MHLSHRRFHRLAATAAALGLSLLAVACSINDPIFTGLDAQVPPSTAVLTVSRAGTSTGTVTSSPNGIDCGTSCSASYLVGTSVTLTAAPDPGAAFAGWSGGGCSGTAPSCTVTLAAATTVTATFDVAQYAVAIALGGSGGGAVAGSAAGLACPGGCTAMVAHGTQLSLTAAADATSQFMGWTVSPGGTACAGTGDCATTITGPATITATFAQLQALEVTRTGTGSGTVTSSPTGIDCGADCSEIYPPGTAVTLTATPASDSIFMGWSGVCAGTGPCSVDMNGARMVTATFTLQRYDLTVSKVGAGDGTVTSSPAGIDCGATCAAAYDAGTVVTVTAVPAVGSTFTGWSGGGCSGTGPCAVTVTAATTVTADFALVPYTLMVTKAGTGSGTVTSSPAGISCGTDCTESYLNGTLVTLTAAASTGSTFTEWSGGGCSGTTPCVVAMSAAMTVTATFTLNTYALTVTKAGTGSGTVTSSPAGISCDATCSATFGHGTPVTLTPAAATGSTFAGWSGGGCSGTGTCTVTMAAATTVTATFTLNTYALTVTKAGTGAGAVTSVPAGINCGSTCSASFAHGTPVVLTATPTTGSVFTGWSGGGCTGTGTCTVTMTAAATVTATFTLNTYTLSVTKAGAGSGTVTSTPAGINCDPTCSATFGHGTLVTLTAAPAAGSVFGGWSGGGCIGTGSCVVTVTTATTVTASFALAPYALTVTKMGNGSGTVTSTPPGIDCGTDCTEPYTNGTMVTLTAVPAASSTFTGWTGAGCSGTGTCTVTVTAAISVTATFTLRRYTLTTALAGTGLGTVVSSPAGISCGTDCSEDYDHGTAVTLTATPVTGSTFTGWSGGGCSGTGTCAVTVTAASAVTATFTLNTYPLSVIKAGTGAGTVTSVPAGINCGTDCSEVYSHGTTVTLTATPTTGSTFAGWSGGGCSGTGSTCTVTMTAATSVMATFTLNTYALTVTKAGTGSGTVTSSPVGISCGADCSEVYGHGTVVTLTAASAADSTFTGWSGGGCSGTGTCMVTLTAATTVTAAYALNTYALTVAKSGTGAGTGTSSPAGINCGADCTESYTHGTSVTLTAAPATGSVFAGWSGGGCSGTGACTVLMIAATNVTASFTLNTYTLAVTLGASTGGGTVTSAPAGINCGSDCSEVYGHGTSVTLTATPNTGSTFSGWSGACSGTSTCTVTMTAATVVTATFAIATHQLTVFRNGNGSGTVTSSPSGITCGTDCTEIYNYGAVVTLIASPATGSTFGGWSGGGCSGTGTCTVTMTAAAAVTATITLNSYTLSVAKGGNGSGSVSSSLAGISCGSDCSEPYDYGTTVTLTSSPATGSAFSGWSGGGCSGTGTCTVTVAAATTVTATFTLNTYALSVTRGGNGSGTVTSSPAGISCGSDCSEAYNYGTTVALTASPATGSTFSGWSGGGCSGTGTCTVTVAAATTVTATFTLNSHTLSVTKSGNGSGSVSSSPAGISCGSDCSEPYNYGTMVTLTASPVANSTFSGWSGGGCSGTGTCIVTMTAATTVAATFTLKSYTLSVSMMGATMCGQTRITSSDGNINCRDDGTGTCSDTYLYGSTVTLTMILAAGDSFGGWTGACASAGLSCQLTITANTSTVGFADGPLRCLH
jgi:hypothetical protein